MRRSLRFSVVLASILIIAQHWPAPIVEEEKPTPAAEQSANPKPKRANKPKVAGESSESSTKRQTSSPQVKPQATTKPERFAGSWNGTINRGLWGDVNYTLIVSATGTSVKEISSWGTYDRPARWDGHTVTFRSGGFNELSCTITPDNEGKSARVTMKGLAANGDSVVYKVSA